MRDLGINRPFDHQVRQFECERICEPTRLGEAARRSHTRLVDPRCGCSKQLRNQDSIGGQHQGHLGGAGHRQQVPDRHLETGFCGSAIEQVA